MTIFGALDCSGKAIVLAGDGRRARTAKHKGDEICKRFSCNIWKKRREHPNVEGVFARRRSTAPSRKICVVNGRVAKSSNKPTALDERRCSARMLIQAAIPDILVVCLWRGGSTP